MMIHNFSKNIILLLFISVFAGCGGGSGGGGNDDGGSLNPATADDPSTAPDDPRDPSGDHPNFNHDGQYKGTCSVSAIGTTSKSCDATLNVYHELENETLGFMGLVDVDMGLVETNMPFASEPLDIKDGKLISSDSGKAIGDINSKGFSLQQDNGDFVLFTKQADGGYLFEGEYQDETYGKILIEGVLKKI